MVKKKATNATTAKAKTRTVYVQSKPKKRRAKSGVTYIPSAMASGALLAVNYKPAKDFMNRSIQYGFPNVRQVLERSKTFVTKDQLIKDGVAVAGGYIGGELVKKFAPTFIKNPLGKLAKKVPKVI